MIHTGIRRNDVFKAEWGLTELETMIVVALIALHADPALRGRWAEAKAIAETIGVTREAAVACMAALTRSKLVEVLKPPQPKGTKGGRPAYVYRVAERGLRRFDVPWERELTDDELREDVRRFLAGERRAA
jgi:predicted transcriptional regulator